MSTIKAGTTSTTAYQVEADTTGNLVFQTNGTTTAMTIDTAQNLGLGVTPSAWDSGKVIEVNQLGTAVWGNGVNNLWITSNAYYNGGNFKYGTGGGNLANAYQMVVGQHRWYLGPAGTNAGDTITFTQAMTLDSAGSLGIGVTSPGARLHVEQNTGSAIFRVKRTANDIFDIYQGSSVTYLDSTPAGGVLAFATAGTERARISAGGDWQVKSGTYATLIAKGGDTNSENWNGAQTSLYVGRVTGTGRSINAGGTINASGADYAEYMTKDGDFIIAKGDVCGIDANGKLTNAYANAVSFVVKSTDPSYVGGDAWGIGLEGEELEAARQKVDRIAFAGQVPVNVLGATPGQYIVPVDDNGAIKGVAVSNPTFEQYQSAVGKVISVQDDGRAWIIVKVA